MTKMKKMFEGDLAKPLQKPKLSPLNEQMMIGLGIEPSHTKWWESQIEKKYYLLMDHYGLEGKDRNGQMLSLLLAIDFVPGFQVKQREKKRGVNAKWNELVLAYLFAEVTRLRDQNPGKSIVWASSVLVKKVPWKSFIRGKDPGEAFRIQYYKAKSEKRLSQLVTDKMRQYIGEGRDLEWEEHVITVVKKSSN